MPQHTIQLTSTSRIRLTPPHPHDDEAVANLHSHPLSLRYLRFLPTKCTVEEACIRRESRAENPEITDFHIHVKNDDGSYSFGGVVGISYIDEANKSGEAGIIVSPHLYRSGVGTEALYSLLKYAFEDRKLHRVTFETGEDNVPMCSWLEKVPRKPLQHLGMGMGRWHRGETGKISGVTFHMIIVKN